MRHYRLLVLPGYTLQLGDCFLQLRVYPLPDACIVEQVVAFSAGDFLILDEIIATDCTLIRFFSFLFFPLFVFDRSKER
jgi:hypothetical protein